jgi:hypothetical protein
MVEIVDGVLELLEDVLLPLALMGDVGDGPQGRLPAAGARHRPDAHPVPAEFLRPAERRREADLLRSGAVLPGRLREPVDRLGHLRSAHEQALDGPHLAPVRPGESKIGLVGVDDPPVVLDHHQPLARGVGHELGDVVAGGLAGELDDPDGDGEEEEHPGHGEERQQPQDQRLGLVAAQEPQAEDRPHQNAGEQQDQPDMARTVGTVDGRGL